MPALDTIQAPTRAATPKPLYAQVRDMLLGRIHGGEWGAGETLPNEHVLSREFDVSIGTVRRAVAELEANGVLVRKQGRGTYLAGRGVGALAERFCALRGDDGTRLAYRLELLSLQLRPGTQAEVACLPRGLQQGVVEIVQLIHVGGAPAGLESSVLPAALLPRLETQMRFGQHLYPVLADYGFLVTRIDDQVSIEAADADSAGHLGCAVGTALLVVHRIAFALDGQPIERRVGRYLASAVRYAAAHGGAPAVV